jgi:hypothetical protein
MTWTGPERGEEVTVPDVVGLEMRAARHIGAQAGVTLAAADPDGPPLGALTWPGTFMVTGQRPGPGTKIRKWGSVVVDFEPAGPGDDAGDREPRIPLMPPSALRAEADESRGDAVSDVSDDARGQSETPAQAETQAQAEARDSLSLPEDP